MDEAKHNSIFFPSLKPLVYIVLCSHFCPSCLRTLKVSVVQARVGIACIIALF